ncbi:MAG: creatininase, partial [Thiomonas sp. 14-66-4]
MNPVMMDRMSWIAYRDRIAEDSPVVFLPCGALEQHGPHLPLGTDALLATAVSAGVAARI